MSAFKGKDKRDVTVIGHKNVVKHQYVGDKTIDAAEIENFKLHENKYYVRKSTCLEEHIGNDSFLESLN